MKKAQLFTATFVVVIMLCQSTYAQKADERAVVAKGFVLAIADGSLSNEQIMKKFVQTRYYFTPDSTELRAAADKHLNDLRKSAQTTDLSSYIAYPFVGHED
jgi:hypothetical protein